MQKLSALAVAFALVFGMVGCGEKPKEPVKDAVKDAAAAYVNCLTSPANRQTWVEKGYTVPIGTTADDLAKWNTLPLVKEFYTQGLATADNNFYDLHTTVPESVTQVLYPELQKLVGGDATPDAFLATMQAAWKAAVDKGERWAP